MAIWCLVSDMEGITFKSAGRAIGVAGCLVGRPRRGGWHHHAGSDLRDLQEQITDAVSAHFDEEAAPRRIRIHFVSDPILVQA